MNSHAVGIDLGGTKIEIAVVNEVGDLLDRIHLATGPAGEPERTVRDLIGCLGEKFQAARGALPISVGVGVAGQVNPGTGIVQFAPNLRWRNVALRGSLERALSVPVKIMNDVHAAAYGEWRYGAGRDCDDLICLFIGTGIGGGVIAGGRFLLGHSGSAGGSAMSPSTSSDRYAPAAIADAWRLSPADGRSQITRGSVSTWSPPPEDGFAAYATAISAPSPRKPWARHAATATLWPCR